MTASMLQLMGMPGQLVEQLGRTRELAASVALRPQSLIFLRCELQEGLAKWRELNSAEHWLAAAAELNPLTASLAQLVHHRDEIAGAAAGALLCVACRFVLLQKSVLLADLCRYNAGAAAARWKHTARACCVRCN